MNPQKNTQKSTQKNEARDVNQIISEWLVSRIAPKLDLTPIHFVSGSFLGIFRSNL